MVFKIPDITFPKLPPALFYTLGILGGLNAVLAIYGNLTTRRYRVKKSLQGKVVVITGGTAGIGKACVQELAKHGATIHILARDLKKAEVVVNEIKKATGNGNIFVHFCNLSDFATVRMFAKNFLASETKIDILINNAALINTTRKVTVDGLEESLQANYLSHFLLTNLLLDRVISSSPSRIINVSSLSANFATGFDVKDMNWENRPHSWFGTYAWTKFEMVVWTRELARRLYGKGVSVNTLCPGGVRSSIFRNMSSMTLFNILTIGRLVSPYLGTQTIMFLATADEVKNVSGHYFSNCQPRTVILPALDDQLAAELWWQSEQFIRGST